MRSPATAATATLLAFLLCGACVTKTKKAGGGKDAAAGSGDSAADVGFSARSPNGLCISGAFERDGECVCVGATACATGCTNLAADGENCGACGHACPANAACNRGSCGPSPTSVLAKPATCPDMMTLVGDGDTLYWTDPNLGAVMKMPAAGGAPSKVSDGMTNAPTLLAAKAGTVFWLDGSLKIFRNAAGAVSLIHTSLTGMDGLAASDDAATVYFSTGPKIQKVAADGSGGLADVELRDTGEPAAIAVQGSFLASVVDITGDVDVIGLGGPVARCGTDDGQGGIGQEINCARVARSLGSINLGVVVLTPTKVLFADGQNLKMGALGATSDGVTESVTFTNSDIVSMVYADGAVYLQTYDGVTKTGTIERAALIRDGTPVALARDVPGQGSIAVAGGKLFWSTGDCEIQSLPIAQ